jgi:ubiquinone/menaquinone biosynthesis C-methylase UbiE
MALYDSIGLGYDTTRHADPFITNKIFRYLNADKRGMYLDLACGSGNYTAALRRKGLNIYGLDISLQMLGLAKRKEPSVSWLLGNVEFLPFKNNTFAGASCILGIHHFEFLNKTLEEAARIIKPGGCLVIFTASREQMENYWLNIYFPQAMKKSIEKMPGEMKLRNALINSGFLTVNKEIYEVKKDLRDLFLYSGKNKPEIYLIPEIRQGISTFTSLASIEEVESGCRTLNLDILSVKIKDITNTHMNRKAGDYLFVFSEK